MRNKPIWFETILVADNLQGYNIKSELKTRKELTDTLRFGYSQVDTKSESGPCSLNSCASGSFHCRNRPVNAFKSSWIGKLRILEGVTSEYFACQV